MKNESNKKIDAIPVQFQFANKSRYPQRIVLIQKAYKSTMSNVEKSNEAHLIHKQANMLPTVKTI